MSFLFKQRKDYKIYAALVLSPRIYFSFSNLIPPPTRLCKAYLVLFFFFLGRGFCNFHTFLYWDETKRVQHDEISIPATSMALQTHSGTSPLRNYKA